jgi:hypothetical protein
MEPNTWVQIHTNGASTTFARFYEAQTDEGATIFRFEKMAADSVNKITEVFGESDYLDVLGAQGRLADAVKTGV